jgi:hypothetical protein
LIFFVFRHHLHPGETVLGGKKRTIPENNTSAAVHVCLIMILPCKNPAFVLKFCMSVQGSGSDHPDPVMPAIF